MTAEDGERGQQWREMEDCLPKTGWKAVTPVYKNVIIKMMFDVVLCTVQLYIQLSGLRTIHVHQGAEWWREDYTLCRRRLQCTRVGDYFIS